jgi:hypothetical protein
MTTTRSAHSFAGGIKIIQSSWTKVQLSLTLLNANVLET